MQSMFAAGHIYIICNVFVFKTKCIRSNLLFVYYVLQKYEKPRDYILEGYQYVENDRFAIRIQIIK